VTNRIRENIDVETEMRCRTRRLNHAIKDNSLSKVLFAPFVVCISAQSIAGWRLQSEILEAHGQSSVGYWDFLEASAFLKGLASNWQAAVLQLGSLIVFSSFLPHGPRRLAHVRRETIPPKKSFAHHRPSLEPQEPAVG
jgi:hypothetical protein